MQMPDLFERQKNQKASAITAGIAGGILLIALLLKWPLPTIPPPVVDEGIEINLGSGDQGFGTDQPKLPGDPAPAQQVAYTPPQAAPARDEAVKDVETDDKVSDAPVITKPANPKPDAKKIDAESKPVKATPATTQPVAATPAPPKPKAVLGRTVGGTGNGGNGADSYERGGNQGIAGGTGDQGRPGGNPNGTAYTGAPKNFGMRVLSIPPQSFEDDFNQNAKIAVEIQVDESGRITSAVLTSKGSTGTATSEMKNTALRLARQLKMGSSDGGQKGIVVFDFKVRG
jgi:outer membrane biosynthesis protein TonB